MTKHATFDSQLRVDHVFMLHAHPYRATDGNTSWLLHCCTQKDIDSQQ